VCHVSNIHLQISSSNRYGASQQAYREVQERHQDIQRVETTLEELAQLFGDVRRFFMLELPESEHTALIIYNNVTDGSVN
jgi:t-SNARE complex subunit (syntaxin)